MLPSPCLAELRGLQHSAVCWQLSPVTLKPVEKGWPRALWAALGTHPTGGSRARQCQQQEGAGSRADTEGEPISSCCLRTGRGVVGARCPKGSDPAAVPASLCQPQSLSFPLPAASLLVQGCNMAKASSFATNSLPPKGTSNTTSILLLDCV